MQSDGARGLLDTSSSKEGRKETAEAWAPAKIEAEIEKMAFNSRSQGTLRKLHHVKAAFDRCTTLNHVHERVPRAA